MPRVGRKRTKDLHLPAGVREIAGRWYWQPTSQRERADRKAKGLPLSVTLGNAGTRAARERWAQLAGYTDRSDEAGTVAELLHLWERDAIAKQPNGEPRADTTIVNYRRAIPVLIDKFGACRYGKTEFEASRGQAIGTADIQRFVSEHPHKGMANRLFAVLDNAFAHAIRVGRTTYNPCVDVVKNVSHAREREPLAWEVECLSTLADRRLGLMMDFEAITGWRVGDILALQRAQLVADGVRVRHQKRGKRQLWEWTPELHRIAAEARTLRGATPFPASPVFPARRGKALSYNAFDAGWQNLKRLANEHLVAGVIDPSTLEVAAGLAIVDLHFHDLRSKAHDDAEEAGHEGHEFLGNTRGVARRHYRRREVKVRPLR